MIVYLVTRASNCGKILTQTQGCFSTEAAAEAACRTWDDTYTRMELDKEYPQECVNCCDVFHPQSGQVMRAGTDKWVNA